MLDPHEPDTRTHDTTEQPAPPAPRRRRAASRPAGPPSTAPNAPEIERPQGRRSRWRGFRGGGDHASGREDREEVRGQAHRQETPEQTSPSEGEVAKTPRRRTAKKAVAMATEAPSDEVRALRGAGGGQQRSRTRYLPRPAWSPMSLSRRS